VAAEVSLFAAMLGSGVFPFFRSGFQQSKG
jgi:hypothetical protein